MNVVCRGIPNITFVMSCLAHGRYKSNKAIEKKTELCIKALPFPKYSPDLMPLDFSVWAEVEKRMSAQKVKSNESVEEFKARLRRTAMAIPSRVIRKIIATIPKRAAAIVKAKGKDIPRD